MLIKAGCWNTHVSDYVGYTVDIRHVFFIEGGLDYVNQRGKAVI